MSKSSIILGIHDGHNSGASLSIGGKIVASVSEERLTRRKNEVGYPEKAIDDVLRIAGISRGDVDEVAYASKFMHSREHLENTDPWYRVGIEEQRSDASKPTDYRGLVFKQRRQERIEQVVEHIGISLDHIQFIEHHEAHLAAALYTAPCILPGQKVLGLTCDGAGDGLAATVSLCQGSKIERIASTDRHASLGKIYSRATKMMGMTPWEHEYKVMGLAPYADEARADEAAHVLRELLRVGDDGLAFELVGELSTNYCYKYLRDSYESVRFDTIAAATQLFTEQMLVEWVRGCIKSTGIHDVVGGGGVFMNVKANMLIGEMDEVNSFYIMPSAADESLSIGACLRQHYIMTDEPSNQASVFENLYLGGGYEKAAEETAIAGARADGLAIEIAALDSAEVDRRTAELLANGAIVARCRGRMEWGARSLGNRSILADATDYRVVTRINNAIKQRDFWMPFAPSVLDKAADRYFDNPKDLCAWYMVYGFRCKPQGYPDLEAASHPRDHTIRPQLVTESANPSYHKVLSDFEARTGRGGFLNTSFNLHGYPIVHTPADAIDVLGRSDIDHLALDNHLISKVSV
jgi:carbamoyltransferase